MNADMLNRVIEAKKYQKKAIMALFPDSMAGHIEVIEKELSAMFMEYAVEVAAQCMQQKNSQDSKEDTEQENETEKKECKKTILQADRHISKVRKVSIADD